MKKQNKYWYLALRMLGVKFRCSKCKKKQLGFRFTKTFKSITVVDTSPIGNTDLLFEMETAGGVGEIQYTWTIKSEVVGGELVIEDNNTNTFDVYDVLPQRDLVSILVYNPDTPLEIICKATDEEGKEIVSSTQIVGEDSGGKVSDLDFTESFKVEITIDDYVDRNERTNTQRKATIPIVPKGRETIFVDWGDGEYTAEYAGLAIFLQHTYATTGVYNVRVLSSEQRINIVKLTDGTPGGDSYGAGYNSAMIAAALTSVLDWGPNVTIVEDKPFKDWARFDASEAIGTYTLGAGVTGLI